MKANIDTKFSPKPIPEGQSFAVTVKFEDVITYDDSPELEPNEYRRYEKGSLNVFHVCARAVFTFHGESLTGDGKKSPYSMHGCGKVETPGLWGVQVNSPLKKSDRDYIQTVLEEERASLLDMLKALQADLPSPGSSSMETWSVSEDSAWEVKP